MEEEEEEAGGDAWRLVVEQPPHHGAVCNLACRTILVLSYVST